MANVLIADDAKFMQMTLRNILVRANHKVIGIAQNGREAVEIYQKLNPDLVIMDITMPIMNGMEAIQKILNIDPSAKIIVCSAVGQQKVIVEAIELGAKDFVMKPFDEKMILESIERVLGT